MLVNNKKTKKKANQGKFTLSDFQELELTTIKTIKSRLKSSLFNLKIKADSAPPVTISSVFQVSLLHRNSKTEAKSKGDGL